MGDSGSQYSVTPVDRLSSEVLQQNGNEVAQANGVKFTINSGPFNSDVVQGFNADVRSPLSSDKMMAEHRNSYP
jgi:hypothetical protein